MHGKGEHSADSAEQAAKDAYERDETDEFITATEVGEDAQIRAGDAVLGFNFRPDRMRQITRALAEDGFDEIDRGGGRGRRALRDAGRVRRGLGLPRRVPARAPRRSRSRR